MKVAGQAGGLAKILVTLETAKVNVEYMYGFTLKSEGKGVLAFRLDDPDATNAALRKAGINPIRSVELFKRLEA